MENDHGIASIRTVVRGGVGYSALARRAIEESISIHRDATILARALRRTFWDDVSVDCIQCHVRRLPVCHVVFAYGATVTTT